MEEFIADLIVGVSVDESNGEYYTKNGYIYIKYDIIGLVGVKLGESNLIPIDLYDVSDLVEYSSLEDFNDMNLYIKLDSSNRCLCCQISSEKSFDYVVATMVGTISYNVAVFDRKLQFLYSVNNSKKAYYDIFSASDARVGNRHVYLEIDISTMNESIVIKKYAGDTSYFSSFSKLMFDCIEPICEKVQDGVYVYGDIAILHEISTDAIVLPKECKYAVFIGCSIKEIVFGKSVEYIGSMYSSFSSVQKIYVSKDSSKEFIGCLLQSIYFSGVYNKLYSKYSLFGMRSISGESFYSICTEHGKRNDEIIGLALKDIDIVVY